MKRILFIFSFIISIFVFSNILYATDGRDKYLFVGDSRMVRLQYVSDNYTDYFLAENGRGYSYMNKIMKPKIIEFLDEYPYATIVFAMGLNDAKNIEPFNISRARLNNYAKFYDSIINTYKNARIYIKSIDPCEDAFRNTQYKNYKVIIWNEFMKEKFPNNFLDTYTYLVENRFVDLKGKKGTTDGIHFTGYVDSAIYTYIKRY